jgi:hypothetical protein
VYEIDRIHLLQDEISLGSCEHGNEHKFSKRAGNAITDRATLAFSRKNLVRRTLCNTSRNMLPLKWFQASAATWGLRSSMMLLVVDWYLDTDVSGHYVTSQEIEELVFPLNESLESRGQILQVPKPNHTLIEYRPIECIQRIFRIFCYPSRKGCYLSGNKEARA